MGYFENINFQVKIAHAFFANKWATFYFTIWSHWTYIVYYFALKLEISPFSFYLNAFFHLYPSIHRAILAKYFCKWLVVNDRIFDIYFFEPKFDENFFKVEIGVFGSADKVAPNFNQNFSNFKSKYKSKLTLVDEGYLSAE